MKTTAALIRRYRARETVPTFPEVRDALKADAAELTTREARVRVQKLLADSIPALNDTFAAHMVEETLGPVGAK